MKTNDSYDFQFTPSDGTPFDATIAAKYSYILIGQELKETPHKLHLTADKTIQVPLGALTSLYAAASTLALVTLATVF